MTRTPMSLPSDKRAEAQLLSIMLRVPDAFYADHVHTLTGKDFFHYGVVWDTIAALRERGKNPTMVMVGNALSEANVSLEEDDWDALTAPEGHDDVSELAQVLRSLQEARVLVEAGSMMTAAGFQRDTAKGLRIAARVLERQTEIEPPPYETQAEVIEKAMQMMTGENGDRGVPTFMQGLNDILAMGGLPRRVSTGLMARSSMGKSRWALQQVIFTATNLLVTGSRDCCIYLSQDGDPAMVYLSYAASFVGLRPDELKDSPLPIRDQVNAHFAFLMRLPIVWNSKGGFTDRDLRKVVDAAKRQYDDVELICADYLQLYSTEGAPDDDRKRINGFLRGWSTVLREGKAAGLLVIQPGRDLEKRDDKRPTLRDARDTSEIENSQEAFLGLFRPGYYAPEDPALVEAGEIVVLKNKGYARNVTHYATFRNGLWLPNQGDAAPLAAYTYLSDMEVSFATPGAETIRQGHGTLLSVNAASRPENIPLPPPPSRQDYLIDPEDMVIE